MPAYTVEPEESQRLGLDVTVDSRPIEFVALLSDYPGAARESDLAALRIIGIFPICVFTQERKFQN